jgi:hypothetical protein
MMPYVSSVADVRHRRPRQLCRKVGRHATFWRDAVSGESESVYNSTHVISSIMKSSRSTTGTETVAVYFYNTQATVPFL